MPPEKVIDVQALAGDSADNVPGVPGIGVKTAAELINEYGDLDTLLARAGEIKQPKRREKLIEFADQARVSRDLVTLKLDVPLEVTLEQMGVQEPKAPELLGFLREMEFSTLTKRIAEKLGRAGAGTAGQADGTGWKPRVRRSPRAVASRRTERRRVAGRCDVR